MNVQKSQIQVHTLGDLFYMQLVAEVSGGGSVATTMDGDQRLISVVGG